MGRHRKDNRKPKNRGRQPLADATNAKDAGARLNVGYKDRSRSRQGRMNRKKEAKEKAKPAVSLLVTEELQKAIDSTKERVEKIVKECRAQNKRYRDTEFDLENDKFRCLHGYAAQTDVEGKDVQRVTQIFDKPQFFPKGGARASSVQQGGLGSCYFLSALSTVAGLPGLIEKVCVARDEEIGVYGFIFYQDEGWVSVIIDDLLYTSIPPWDSLDEDSKNIYLHDRDLYEDLARKGGKTLVYCKAGEEGETWVPLIEKAYAKLYGCFAHIEGGFTREAIEDLTGGVSSLILTKDILSRERFWKEELGKVNEDRLFACAFNASEAPDDQPWGPPTVQGLYPHHAYAVLRTAEIKGKRFVIVRNPWGKCEWTGKWSDGSKEWTGEWLKALPELGYTFGDDGQFVMEYSDFLNNFSRIDRVLLFDHTWTVASCWLQIPLKKTPTVPSYGTLSFMVELKQKTKTVFVVSGQNTRAFDSLNDETNTTFSYAVVRVGDLAPLATSGPDAPFHRSGSLEIELEAGHYVVYVQLEQSRVLKDLPLPASVGRAGADSDSDSDSDSSSSDGEDENGFVWFSQPEPTSVNTTSRVVSKLLNNKVKALSIAQNWDESGAEDFMPKSLEDVIKEDLEELRGGSAGGDENEDDFEDVDDDDGNAEDDDGEEEADTEGERDGNKGLLKAEDGATAGNDGNADNTDSDGEEEESYNPVEWVDLLDNKESNKVVFGLKVYTQTKVPAVITGRLKTGATTEAF